MVKILKYNNKCRKLCAKARKSGKSADYTRYKQYHSTLNRLKLSESRLFYAHVFEKIDKNAKMLWEVLN